MSLRIIGHEDVRRHLDFKTCIGLVRTAMVALSRGETQQVPRQIIRLQMGRAFGIMPGSMGEAALFGAKLVSVFPDNFAKGRPSHQGVITLFDPVSGEPNCIVHAGEVTRIRTAAASAAATDALARPDATRLAVLGYGEQAEAHIHAIAAVRPLSGVRIWGRDPGRRTAFAARLAAETGLACTAADDVEAAVEQADIICTTTAAAEPILKGAWILPGTHLNVVGSSHLGPVEVDDDLVVRARFFADHRPSVLAQGAEFAGARERGVIDDSHLLAEIGEVFAGTHPGRLTPDDVTLYKSLGHVVQDLAAAAWLQAQGFGAAADF